MKGVAVLGSTGSIGTSTLSVIEAFPDRFQAVALAAGSNLELLLEQARRHRPRVVSVRRREDAERLARELPDTAVHWGEGGLDAVACADAAEVVVAALVGSVGLVPTLAAIRAGKNIALANKETMVVAGELVTAEVARAGVELLPVDSEHNALHQALCGGPPESVRRLLLTASGGPFRTWPAARIRQATVEDALAHPTWQMGAKITIDSATMMNKGLEIIEARHLFGVPEERIGVVVHPQSLVHSLVEYVDGTLLAQLSVTDMRFPIQYALTWPERVPTPLPFLDLVEAGTLTFEAPDPERFPTLDLARRALREGGEMPAVLNAANEVAVAAFLERRLAFPGIAEVIRVTMDRWAAQNRPLESLEQALAADAEARAIARAAAGKFPAAPGSSNTRC